MDKSKIIALLKGLIQRTGAVRDGSPVPPGTPGLKPGETKGKKILLADHRSELRRDIAELRTCLQETIFGGPNPSEDAGGADSEPRQTAVGREGSNEVQPKVPDRKVFEKPSRDTSNGLDKQPSGNVLKGTRGHG